MKSKKIVVYSVLFGIVSFVTALGGFLCIYFDRLYEGVIIVGLTLILIAIYIMTITKPVEKQPSKFKMARNKKKVLAQAGLLRTSLECMCRINGGHSQECELGLYDNGLIIDMEGVPFKLIPYVDVFLQDSGSAVHIQLQIAGIGLCRCVCNSKIKIKAITQLITKTKTKIFGVS